MFYNESKVLLFLLTIIELASHTHQVSSNKTYNDRIVNKLNALLKNVGWSRLNHLEVKYHDNSCAQSSFSGVDLFIGPKEPDEFHVTEKNVEKKYCMANKLLGCVYATAVSEFIHLTDRILDECEIAVRRADARAYFQKHQYKERCKVKVVIETFHVKPGNFSTSCILLNDGLELFENGRQMFDYMACALNYLVEPLMRMKGYHVIQKYIQSLKESVIKIRDLKTTLHYEYHESADTNIRKYYQILRKILNRQVKKVLSPLMEKYCILPKEAHDVMDLNKTSSVYAESIEDETIEDEPIEDETINQPLEESEHSEVKLQIKNHVEKVINEYFLSLGFRYVEIPN